MSPTTERHRLIRVAEQPDDPTLCGGKAVPGSYAWVKPPTFASGVLTVYPGWILRPLPREERLAVFCGEGRAMSTGWYGEARQESCL